MPPLLLTLVPILAAYLVGAVPFGYLVARWRGVDIFQAGSGNIGATNIGRILGKRFGVLVFLLDFAKGALPTAAALAVKRLAEPAAQGELPLLGLEVFAGLAAFLGHVFPIYIHFHGGKGVATGAGVVTVLLPLPALGAIATWLVLVAAFRYVSLASLAAALALLALHLATADRPFAGRDGILTAFCLLAAALVFLRHRGNLARLLRGEENRIRETTAMQLLAKTIHVLALGLWFGAAVFFSFVVAPSLFASFEAAAELPRDQRPVWFPAAERFTGETVRKEQGTRAAGFAVGPLFAYYFLLQGICGFTAVLTALGWSRAEPGSRVHRLRLLVLLAALMTVLVGWPLERKVTELRAERHDAADAALKAPQDTQLAALAQEKRAEFGRWHLYSLGLNLLTILLVGVGMALAARLPTDRPAAAASDSAASPGPTPDPPHESPPPPDPGTAPPAYSAPPGREGR
jgi:acyl-phosphate glycerol 3-phosphate acyltransferase